MFAIMTTVRCARSEVGLSRLPVTEEIAGSNPVGRARMRNENVTTRAAHLCRARAVFIYFITVRVLLNLQNVLQ